MYLLFRFVNWMYNFEGLTYNMPKPKVGLDILELNGEWELTDTEQFTEDYFVEIEGITYQTRHVSEVNKISLLSLVFIAK